GRLPKKIWSHFALPPLYAFSLSLRHTCVCVRVCVCVCVCVCVREREREIDPVCVCVLPACSRGVHSSESGSNVLLLTFRSPRLRGCPQATPPPPHLHTL